MAPLFSTIHLRRARQKPPSTPVFFAGSARGGAVNAPLNARETHFPAGREVFSALAQSLLNFGIQMNDSITLEPASLLSDERKLPLVLNLVGFERSPEYHLISRPSEEPFLRLQSMSDPRLEFLVVEPHHVHPDYEPDVNPRDVAYLALGHDVDALVLNVVTIHSPGRVTANLRGPIVINRQTGRGRQVIPDNVREFSLQHPVQVEA